MCWWEALCARRGGSNGAPGSGCAAEDGQRQADCSLLPWAPPRLRRGDGRSWLALGSGCCLRSPWEKRWATSAAASPLDTCSMVGCSRVPWAGVGGLCSWPVVLVAPKWPPAAEGLGAGWAPAPTAAAAASLMKPSRLMHVTYYNCNCD